MGHLQGIHHKEDIHSVGVTSRSLLQTRQIQGLVMLGHCRTSSLGGSESSVKE